MAKALSRRSTLFQSGIDVLLTQLLRAIALIGVGMVLLVVAFIVLESMPILSKIGIVRFLTDGEWYPTASAFGLAPMIVGSLLLTVGAVLVSLPFALASAVFCNYYAPPRVANLYRRFMEVVTGVPSVVYGYWGLVVLVPVIAAVRAPGTSLLAGVLVLILVVLPTMALIADASLANIPRQYLRGPAALGIRRWAIIRNVLLPIAKPGIASGVLLAGARAIGETMAVLMVSGNIVRFPETAFDPVRALTSNIALEMAYAMDDHRAALFTSGLTLLILVLSLVLLNETVARRPG